MRRPVTLLVLLLLLLAVPNAAAYPAPALYFLRDGANGPVEDGLLAPEAPNGSEPSVRPVPAGVENVDPILFFAADGPDRPRILRGPVFVGLWTDASPVLDANLTVILHEVHEGGHLVPLARGEMNLQANPENAPNATDLIPPDPTDPQGSVFYELAQVTPVIMSPARLINLGRVDVLLSEGTGVAVEFRLNASSGNQLPLGAFATLRYDADLSPSYVFVPWYEPDPERPTPTSRPTTGRPGATTTGTAGSPGGEDLDGGGSPGPGLLFVVVAMLAAAAWAARRRR